jgi:hypothetical protein
MESVDLQIENYELTDIFALFKLQLGVDLLTEDKMRRAKRVVLKTHPDKSGLESKYFIFFSKAYKRLYEVYEFQNKATKSGDKQEVSYINKKNNLKEEYNLMLDAKLSQMSDTKSFNDWFNYEFEKMRIKDELTEGGYGDWLKTDEGIMDINKDIKVTKANMGVEMEKQRRQMKTVVKYSGVKDMVEESGCFLGDVDNYTTGQYMDLRQAHTETLIPITEDDFSKIRKYNSITEYKNARDAVSLEPLTGEESMSQLREKEHIKEIEAVNRAYKYAKEMEQVKDKQSEFWASMMRLER